MDRWDRRRTLLIAQGLRAVVSALLTALIITGHVRVWQFVTLAVLDGLCAAFIGPVQDTAIRGIVPSGRSSAGHWPRCWAARRHSSCWAGCSA
ncbi:MFS transporter [Streptosporangium sandarakinum]|uniref:MFS transporter n=1 Tax=Streptosporangium sandarakinum TaxID=1260955 RepID=UPI00342F89EC